MNDSLFHFQDLFNLMKFLKYLFFFWSLVICFIFPGNLKAQSLPQNLSNINVKDLSDAQIRNLLQQAQASGYTDNQVLAQAQSRGMTDDQVQALQKRITDIRTKDGTNTNGNNLDGIDTSTQKVGNNASNRKLNFITDTSSIIRQRNLKDIYDGLKPKIFGADLFKDKNIKFEPNLKIATPLNYIVGPEDQILINVYGKSVANWKLDVSSEGNINIPGIGLLNVSGKTIEHATNLIKERLKASNYALGNGTSVQVNLGNIRSIKVIIIGQAFRPGTYTLPSLATVFNALYAAGGPAENGSFRLIQVIRNNKVVSHFDLYDFLTKGEQKNNLTLQDQDVIQIPTYRNRVELFGEVKIPGLFETLPGETLNDLLKFSGGFNEQAYTSKIKVVQVSDQQKKLTDVLENDFQAYTPIRGDKYIIEKILNRYENRVTISGAVFRPGEYELQKGITVSGLIANAAGLKEDAFEGRGNITRLKPDNTKELISFSLKDIVNKKTPDIFLQREDSVRIVSIFDLRDKYKVTIQGEVRKPGKFAYKDSMTVQDLIIEAGGFAEGGSSKRIEVARRINNGDPNSKNSIVAQVFSVNVDIALKNREGDFILKPYDIVSIYGLPGYEKQRTLKVEGEILYPGYYTIQQKNEKISDIILRAGGLTASADIEGGTLKRSNLAILGVEKNKADTLELQKERIERLNRLKKTFKDSTKTEDTVARNNFVGIDLKEILEKPGSDIDLLVEDGDVIRIPKKQQVVRVNGDVLFPSAVVFNNGKNFNDYVLNAGGYSPRAYKSGAYIVYPNGTVRGTKHFLFFRTHPDVKPGSEIYVPKKPEPKGDTGVQILGYATAIASLASIIITIIKL